MSFWCEYHQQALRYYRRMKKSTRVGLKLSSDEMWMLLTRLSCFIRKIFLCFILGLIHEAIENSSMLQCYNYKGCMGGNYSALVIRRQFKSLTRYIMPLESVWFTSFDHFIFSFNFYFIFIRFDPNKLLISSVNRESPWLFFFRRYYFGNAYVNLSLFNSLWCHMATVILVDNGSDNSLSHGRRQATA